MIRKFGWFLTLAKHVTLCPTICIPDHLTVSFYLLMILYGIEYVTFWILSTLLSNVCTEKLYLPLHVPWIHPFACYAHEKRHTAQRNVPCLIRLWTETLWNIRSEGKKETGMTEKVTVIKSPTFEKQYLRLSQDSLLENSFQSKLEEFHIFTEIGQTWGRNISYLLTK